MKELIEIKLTVTEHAEPVKSISINVEVKLHGSLNESMTDAIDYLINHFNLSSHEQN